MRARHGIKRPPQYIFYKGKRADLEQHLANEEDAMDEGQESKKAHLYELYDKLGADAGLVVKRPDYDDCIYYLAGKQEELKAVRSEIRDMEKAGWPDIRAFDNKKSQRDALLRIINFMTCNQTAQPGYLYAKATPRNAGKILMRCSNPRGNCFSQTSAEVAHNRVTCHCNWPFYLCQRFLTIMPPEGSQMEIEYVNLRIKKGYGVNKVAKPIKGKDGHNIPGEFMWGNANPKNKQEFGDPPVTDPTKGSHVFWPGQKAALNEHTTNNMMYKTFYTPFYSTYQEVPVATWDVGDDQPAFPYQFMSGDENPFCGLFFDPILMSTDNMDGRLRQLRGNGQHETIPAQQIYWCEDDPLHTFLQNLRDSKDAIMLAAAATSNPLSPKFQDGHGWNYVHPNDSPTIGPVVGKHLVKAGVTDMTDIRSIVRDECTNFFIDCGINQNSMCQLVPEHYRQSAARTINVDPEVGILQDHMHQAYKKL